MRRCATCGHAVVVQFVLVGFGSTRARALCQPERSWSSAQKQFFFPDRGEFTNRRKSRSRRGNEAEVFFAPKSASLRRRLPFLNTPCGGAPVSDPAFLRGSGGVLAEGAGSEASALVAVSDAPIQRYAIHDGGGMGAQIVNRKS